MKIALVPLNPIVGDIKNNAEKIIQFIDQAIEKECHLIIFPELSLIGYPPKDYLFYPFLFEMQQKALQKIKRRSKKIAIILGGINKHKGTGRPFNNLALVFHNGQKHAYAKQLLPNYDVFDEWRYFSPGNEPLILRIGGKKIGLTICEDIWFDEESVKIAYNTNPLTPYIKRKVDYLVNISASPYEFDKMNTRAKLLSQVSKKMNCPVIYVNQMGANDDLVFDGRALVYNKNGQKIFESPAFTEKVFIFDSQKATPIPPKRLTRLEQYDLLEQALITGIRDYVRKSGFSKVLFGLSGGVDSALVACLAARALGSKNVLGIMLPSRYSSEGSITDSVDLAKNLKIKTKKISIDSLHETYEKLFETILDKADDLTNQNIQARIRANILMAISNNTGGLLLNTTNKSEMAMGYGTLYGDMCGALSVLSDVTKTQVYELCNFINSRKLTIPTSIITKPPSAELKPDQKDEDSLPPYDELDPILDVLINHHGDDIEFGVGNELETWVMKSVMRNEYKRFQAAPGLKISSKAFGSGRRVPIVGKFNF
jgi:NAD+ synthase (glutamine-hydrolysing)